MIVSKQFTHRKVKIIPSFPISRGIGFRFTPEDNCRMFLHCCAAAKFMSGFGQAPRPPEIDLTHYENSNKTKWYNGK